MEKERDTKRERFEAAYCGAGGPDAVEHVGAKGDADEDVLGVALWSWL